MRIFTAIGIVIFGCLAVAGFIKPFIDSMMPTIIEVATNDAEIAMWGLMPILILIMLIPCAILIIRRNKRQ